MRAQESQALADTKEFIAELEKLSTEAREKLHKDVRELDRLILMAPTARTYEENQRVTAYEVWKLKAQGEIWQLNRN